MTHCERCGGTHVVDFAAENPDQLVFDLGVAFKQPCPVCSSDDDDDYYSTLDDSDPWDGAA